MALDFFGITRGLELDDVLVLQGTGAPGSSTDTNSAPVGSVYLRNDQNSATGENNLQFYWKHAAGSGADKWSLAASKSYIDAMQQGLSWREPVKAMVDTVAAKAAIEASLNADNGLDGVALAEGDRVVLSGVTGANKNVYIVTGTPGSGATLVEDTNTLTDGDALLVQQGTHADEQWAWDATTSTWVQFGGAASSAELGYIRAFIGKNAGGSEFPDFGSNDIVIDGQSLESEIGRLDDAVGTLTFSSTNILTNYSDTFPTTPATYDITTNLNAIDFAFGDGSVTNTTANYALASNMQWGTTGSLTVTGAFNALNDAIGGRTYTGNIVTSGQTVTASIEALDVVLGDLNNSSVYTAAGFLPSATIAGQSVQTTLNSFNQALGDFAEHTYENTQTNIATATNLESGALLESEATQVKWILQFRDHNGGSPSTRRRAVEIHAMSNGSGGVDFNIASILKTGTAITGVSVDVTIASGAWAVTVNPGVNTLDATIKRVTYSYLG